MRSPPMNLLTSARSEHSRSCYYPHLRQIQYMLSIRSVASSSIVLRSSGAIGIDKELDHIAETIQAPPWMSIEIPRNLESARYSRVLSGGVLHAKLTFPKAHPLRRTTKMGQRRRKTRRYSAILVPVFMLVS